MVTPVNSSSTESILFIYLFIYLANINSTKWVSLCWVLGLCATSVHEPPGMIAVNCCGPLARWPVNRSAYEARSPISTVTEESSPAQLCDDVKQVGSVPAGSSSPACA